MNHIFVDGHLYDWFVRTLIWIFIKLELDLTTQIWRALVVPGCASPTLVESAMSVLLISKMMLGVPTTSWYLPASTSSAYTKMSISTIYWLLTVLVDAGDHACLCKCLVLTISSGDVPFLCRLVSEFRYLYIFFSFILSPSVFYEFLLYLSRVFL